MILIALCVLLIGSFFYDSRKFPYMLVTYYVFYDMFDGFYKEDKIYSVFRYVIPLLLILIYMARHNVQKKLDAIFVIVMMYLMALWAFNPGDELITAKNVLPLLITLLLIPIGKHLAETRDFKLEFEKYNRIMLVSIPLYIVYANVAGISGFYSDAFSTGFLVTSRMYIVSIVVFLAIHYALTNKNRSWMVKTIDVSFILINLCMLLINTRRTTLAMLAAAIIVYTMFNRRLFFKMIMLLVVLIGALVVSYPLYEERLTAQLERRERIQNLDTYEEEARLLETYYLIDYHKKKEDIGELLFGVKLFDTLDFGVKYFGRDRPIHSDFNMLFFSTGLLGMLLFFKLFLHYFFKRNRLIAPNNKILFYPLLANFLIILFPGRFIGTLTFAPLLMLLLTALKYEKALVQVPEPEETAPVMDINTKSYARKLLT